MGYSSVGVGINATLQTTFQYYLPVVQSQGANTTTKFVSITIPLSNVSKIGYYFKITTVGAGTHTCEIDVDGTTEVSENRTAVAGTSEFDGYIDVTGYTGNVILEANQITVGDNGKISDFSLWMVS